MGTSDKYVTTKTYCEIRSLLMTVRIKMRLKSPRDFNQGSFCHHKCHQILKLGRKFSLWLHTDILIPSASIFRRFFSLLWSKCNLIQRTPQTKGVGLCGDLWEHVPTDFVYKSSHCAIFLVLQHHNSFLHIYWSDFHSVSVPLLNIITWHIDAFD